MTRPLVVALTQLVLLATACSRGQDGRRPGPADDLVKIARAGDSATYKAEYEYTSVGKVESAVRATLTVARRPPDSVHALETALQGGKSTFTQWTVRRGDRTWSCTDVGGRSCAESPGSGEFGFNRVDAWFDRARGDAAFGSVRRGRPRTVAGADGTCYQAAGRRATPAPVSSPSTRYDPDRFSYEYCYTREGIPLYVRELAEGPVPSGNTRAEFVLEATSVARTVDDADLALPGPVRTPAPPGQPARSP